MNFDDIEVKINKPYPEIVGAREDSRTVGILKNLLSYRCGELGAILQYNYQSVLSFNSMEEISDILEEISIVEMEHMELLMHAIVQFGGLPKFENSQGNMFSAGQVDYSVKLKDMLEANINDETCAIHNYEDAILKVKNESLKNLFKRIIEDEERHLQIFKRIRDNVKFLSL